VLVIVIDGVENRGQRREDRDQMSEVRGQRSEVRDQRSAIRNSERCLPANAGLDMTGLWLWQSTAANSDLPAPVSLLPAPITPLTIWIAGSGGIFLNWGFALVREEAALGLCHPVIHRRRHHPVAWHHHVMARTVSMVTTVAPGHGRGNQSGSANRRDDKHWRGTRFHDSLMKPLRRIRRSANFLLTPRPTMCNSKVAARHQGPPLPGDKWPAFAKLRRGKLVKGDWWKTEQRIEDRG